jgi:hypothetical protein
MAQPDVDDVDFAAAKLHVWRTKGDLTSVRLRWRRLDSP